MIVITTPTCSERPESLRVESVGRKRGVQRNGESAPRYSWEDVNESLNALSLFAMSMR